MRRAKTSFKIRDDDRCVQETFNRLQSRVDDLKPVMREIAGHLAASGPGPMLECSRDLAGRILAD